MFRSNSSCLGLLSLIGVSCQPLHDLDEATRGTSDSLDTSETPTTTHATNTEEGSTPSPSTTANNVDSQTSLATESDPSTSGSVGDAGALDSMDEPSPTSAPSNDAALSSASTLDGVDTTQTSGSPTSTEAPDPASTNQTSSESTRDPSSGETSGAATCEQDCALGTSCSTLTNCASLRCDDTCQPTQLRIESDGIDAISTSIKIHFELYADPSVPVAWSDLAVVYFVTVEARDDFVLHYSEGGGTALPMQVTLDDWMIVWTTDAAGNVPSTVTPIDVQFRSDPWLPDEPASNTNSNDYSYLPEIAPNDKIVLCRNIDGNWTHIQGNPPPTIPDPCSLVNNCDKVLSCDEL